MNRRTFLTGLLSTAAAVSTASGVVAIAPRALTDEEIFDFWMKRVNAAYELMREQFAKQLYESSTESEGGLATLLYLTDEEPIRYQHAEFGVEVIFQKEP